MDVSDEKRKKSFYEFFNLSDDYQLVTHINKETGELEDSYTVEFSFEDVKFKAWVHLHDEYAIYEYFDGLKDKIFVENEINGRVLYKDRWKNNMQNLLEDIFVSQRGYTILISLDQKITKDTVVYPVQDFCAGFCLFNRQETPPFWMSVYDIGKTQAFYKSVDAIEI